MQRIHNGLSKHVLDRHSNGVNEQIDSFGPGTNAELHYSTLLYCIYFVRERHAVYKLSHDIGSSGMEHPPFEYSSSEAARKEELI